VTVRAMAVMGGGWRGRATLPKPHQGQGHFTRRLQRQQSIHAGISEAKDHMGREHTGSGCGQEVGQHGAGIPKAVPIGSSAILPGITPERIGGDKDHRGLRQSRRLATGVNQAVAIIPLS
jgi:hypothetical protein